MASPPVCLTIAGSDCSSGAGAQADLKTFSAFGIYGLTAITAVVSEIPGLVTAWESVSPDLLTSQLDTLKGGFPLAAIKTGMLATPELVARVCQFLEGLRAPFPLLPVVVDPVMIASSALYEIISAVIFGAAKGAQARPPKMADEDADRRCGAEI